VGNSGTFSPLYKNYKLETVKVKQVMKGFLIKMSPGFMKVMDPSDT
jgi:hypothetical protein